jgi:hypothetical protein
VAKLKASHLYEKRALVSILKVLRVQITWANRLSFPG